MGSCAKAHSAVDMFNVDEGLNIHSEGNARSGRETTQGFPQNLPAMWQTVRAVQEAASRVSTGVLS